MALGLLNAFKSFAVDYTYTTNTTTSSGSSDVSPVVSLAVFAVLLAVFLFIIVSVWKVYQKAGRPGWASIVPFYNVWVLLEMGGQAGWLVFLALIPFVGAFVLIVFEVIALIEIGRRFGKTALWSFFMLFVLPIIGWPMLAFGDAKYTDPSAGGDVNGATPVAAAAPQTNPMPPATPEVPSQTPNTAGPAVPPSAPPVPPAGEQTPPQNPTVG